MFRMDFKIALLIILGIFTAASLIGGLFVFVSPDSGKLLVEMMREQFVGTVIDTEGFILPLKIFLNNLQACTLLFLGGASFGLLTLFIILMNGVVIGGVLEVVREQQSLLYVAAAVLPHGAFEIPSFVVSGALGIMLADALYREWFKEGNAAEDALHLGRIFLTVVIPLLVVAALVEAFITPEIINLVI